MFPLQPVHLLRWDRATALGRLKQRHVVENERCTPRHRRLHVLRVARAFEPHCPCSIEAVPLLVTNPLACAALGKVADRSATFHARSSSGPADADADA